MLVSFCVHLLIRIYAVMNDGQKKGAIQGMRISALEKAIEKIEMFISWAHHGVHMTVEGPQAEIEEKA